VKSVKSVISYPAYKKSSCPTPQQKNQTTFHQSKSVGRARTREGKFNRVARSPISPVSPPSRPDGGRVQITCTHPPSHSRDKPWLKFWHRERVAACGSFDALPLRRLAFPHPEKSSPRSAWQRRISARGKVGSFAPWLR